jgi:branched-chain amino acid transport system ATP-binding protein
LSQGLAPKLVLELFNTIKKLNDEYGVSILLVEQYVTESLKISHRAYVMELGRIVLEGPSSEVAKSEYLRRAYLAV